MKMYKAYKVKTITLSSSTEFNITAWHFFPANVCGLPAQHFSRRIEKKRSEEKEKEKDAKSM